MYIEFLVRNNFRQKYLDLFAQRFSYGSLTIENEMNGYTDTESIVKIYNNKIAFEKLLDENKERLNIGDIQDVASTVHQNLKYFSDGFRKINIMVQGAPFVPPAPEQVYEAMYYLLNSYYKIWDLLPTFEREARFHIGFIQIHPFEDGNGRTGRILMNYNLCKNNKAPIVIEKKDRGVYFDLINHSDVTGLAQFIKEKSNQELEVMMQLYSQICGDNDINSDIKENDQNVKIYNLQRKAV